MRRRERQRKLAELTVLLLLVVSTPLLQGCPEIEISEWTLDCPPISMTVSAGECEELRPDPFGHCTPEREPDFEHVSHLIYRAVGNFPPGFFARHFQGVAGEHIEVCAEAGVPAYRDHEASYHLTVEEIPSMYECPVTPFNPFSTGICIGHPARYAGSAPLFLSTRLGVTATADPIVISLGSSTQLNAVTGGSAAALGFEWSSNPAGSTISDPSIPNPVATPDVTTNFTVEVRGSTPSQLLFASDSVVVCVSNLSLAVSASPSAILQGETSQLLADVSGGTPPYEISWKPADSLDDHTIHNPIASPWFGKRYEVRVEDAAGCVLIDDVLVRVIEPLSLIVSATPGSIVLGGTSQIATSVSGGAPPYSYSWDDPTDTLHGLVVAPVAMPQDSTAYSLTVTDSVGNQVTETVAVHLIMQLAVTAIPSLISLGTPVNLAVAVTVGGAPPPYTYLWDPASGLPFDSPERNKPDPRIWPTASETYWVTVTDSLGQAVRGSVDVTVNVGIPEPGADLEIRMSTDGNVTTVGRGDRVAFLILVENHGPDTATGVTFIDHPIPPLISSGPFVPGCSDHGGDVRCEVGTIPATHINGPHLVYADVDACAADADVVNIATVSGQEHDGDSANDSASYSLTVEVPAPPLGVLVDLELTTAEAAPSTVAPGDIFAFNLGVTNNSIAQTAHGVLVRYTLPNDIVFEPDFSSECSESSRIVTCCLGDIAAEAEWRFALFVSVHPAAIPTTAIDNVFNVQGDESDSAPGNDHNASNPAVVTVQ